MTRRAIGAHAPWATPTWRRLAVVAGAMLLVASHGAALGAQGGALAVNPMGIPRYPQQTGEALYKGVCQGCHMADARGASGAGKYPALAGDPRLVAVAYPISVVANGQRAMPAFGTGFSDAQIAAVVNYVRTHFGNSFTDSATAADVLALRRPRPPDF